MSLTTFSNIKLWYLLSKSELIDLELEVLRISIKHLLEKKTEKRVEAFKEAFKESIKMVKGTDAEEKNKELLEMAAKIYRGLKEFCENQ